MIKSHEYGGYIPTTLDDEHMDIDKLKKERDFLQFVYNLKYNPKVLGYLNRLFTFAPREDTIFKLGDSGSDLWRLNKDEMKNLIDEISREIMRRNRLNRYVY